MSSSNGQYDMNHWLSRLTAYIVDGIITGIIAAAIWFPLTFLDGVAGSYFVENWAWLGYSLIWGAIQVVYFTALETHYGTSVGKRFLGFQVQQTNGSNLTVDKALIRNLSKIFWPLLIIDCLISAFSTGADKRQKLSDRIAQTTVIAITHAFVTPPPLKTLPT
jgi:uncharacterized RDD family membrane protein YckC